MEKEFYQNYGNAEMCSAFYYSYKPSGNQYPIRNKGRRHYGFVYSFAGCETYDFGDRILTVPEGCLIFIPKNAKYTVTLEGEMSTVISFDFELPGEPRMKPFCLNIGNYGGIPAIMRSAETCCRMKKAGYTAELTAYYYQITSLMIRYESEYKPIRNRAKISRAVDYLHEHYSDSDFRISKLHEISGLDPKYFGTLFNECLGESPKKYAMRLRIERAKELLCADGAVICDVAETLGFSDEYHFSKAFHQAVGVPPGEYRRRNG